MFTTVFHKNVYFIFYMLLLEWKKICRFPALPSMWDLWWTKGYLKYCLS
jgi:hypothetical protein